MRSADVYRLVGWWASGGESGVDLLTEDFVYMSELECLGKGEFVLAIASQEPQRELRILACFLGTCQAAVFFEMVDPITSLTHRVAWLLDLDGPGIRKLTATQGIIGGVYERAPVDRGSLPS